MRCAECRPLLSKYVDGEAAPDERAQVEAHIGACTACSRRLVEFRVLRTRVGDLPRYQPDSELRGRLFAAIDALHTPDQDVPITRRIIQPAPQRARRAAPRRNILLGNLVSAFAMVIVLLAGLVVWQISGNGPSMPVAYATSTAASRLAADATGTAASRLAVMAVPTRPVPISQQALPPAQPTALAGLGPADAVPTAYWQPSEDPAQVHTVRDATYGYQFQYPGGWWTASTIPVAGVLARRLVRPWSRSDGDTANSALTLDVLDNSAALSPDAVLANRTLLRAWGEPGADATPVAVALAGLSGFTLQSQTATQQRKATYLFAGALVYRISLDVALPPRPSSTHPLPPATGSTGSAVSDLVLSSFEPATGAANQPAGYAPLLYVHAGDLWQFDPGGAAPRQLTTSGRVVAFAVSPDLAHVALLLGQPGSDGGSRQVAVRSLSAAADAETVIWAPGAVQAIAWYGDQEVVALGGGDSAARPFGLYRLAASGPAAARLVADLSGQPAVVSTASALAVSPDRLWISYLVTEKGGPVLYGVHPDGQGLQSLLPAAGGLLGLTQYAWLPPAEGDTAAQLLLVTGKQLQRLRLAGPGGSALAPVADLPGSTCTDLQITGAGTMAALAWTAGRPEAYLRQVLGTPADAQVMDLSGTPVPGSLRLSPAGQYLFYSEPTAQGGAERMMMVDLAGQSSHSLGDLP